MKKRWSGLLVALPFIFASLPGDAQEAGYTVKPGDLLTVSVWKEEALQGDVLVTPDGAFAFPLVGLVDARNKTVDDLQKVLTERLTRYISEPVVTVAVKEIRGNKIYVIGQVGKSGEFVVNPRVDVMQALAMAGGMTPFASLGNIMVIRRTGAQQEALPFDYNAVAKGKDLKQNFELRSGDIVVVP